MDHHDALVSGGFEHLEAEITVQTLQDQHVLILGLGASGLAMARWCSRCGAKVTVADTRAAPPQLATLQRAISAIAVVPPACSRRSVLSRSFAMSMLESLGFAGR